MLEIGIGLKSHEDEMKMITNNYIGGNSLLMWKDYFNQAIVHGMDIYNTNRFDWTHANAIWFDESFKKLL